MRNTVMLWEVVLLTSAITAASHLPALQVAASNMSPRDGLDSAGMPFNNTEFFTLSERSMVIITEPQEQGLDAAGLPINTNEDLSMFEEEIDFDSWNSIVERGVCSPTPLCTRAGGYCVKSPADCDGILDPRGCKGGKKCKCCIPDQTTPAPCPTCAPCTTPGPTVSPNLNWLSVGSDRFVRFDQEMHWNDARALCRSHGLDLYHPRDIVAVSIYLEDNFSNYWYWLGAQGNGTHQVWFNGVGLTRDDPWYRTYYTYVGTNDCLALITWNGEPARGTVLFGTACTGRTNIDVLCG